jgi:hypothetical protein
MSTNHSNAAGSLRVQLTSTPPKGFSDANYTRCHDHTASTKKRKVYCHGSVYVLCHHLQIGWIECTLNRRLYLRKDTVRRINRRRPADQRIVYQSKLDLVREMLTEMAPLLPPDLAVYIEFDSWYSSAPLINWIRKQGWHVVGGLKANRQVNHRPLRQRWHALWNTPVALVTLPVQDGNETTYRVRSCVGRLNHVADPIQVFVSKRDRRDPHPAYFPKMHRPVADGAAGVRDVHLHRTCVLCKCSIL